VAGLLGLKGSRVWDNYPGRGVRPFKKYIMLYAYLLLLAKSNASMKRIRNITVYSSTLRIHFAYQGQGYLEL